METEEETPKKRVVTLDELGPVLPFGISDGNGGLNKSFSLRAWKFKHEKQLAEMKEKAKTLNAAQYANMILSTMCTDIGGHNLEAESLSERKRVISNMVIGDVLYTYVYLRMQAVGPVMKVNIACPACKSKILFPADLATVDVTVIDEPVAADWKYKLRDKFEVRGKPVTELEFGPARWSSIENASQKGMNEAILHELMMRNSLKGVSGDKHVIMTSDDFDELSKFDYESVSSLMEENHIGPDMSIEATCKECDNEIKMSLNWANDDFFAVSSR